jgi:lysozyme
MQFVDISAAQPSIDWPAYRQWSSVVAIKATEGIGYTSPTFAAQRAGAIAAGIDTLLLYHFARPDLGNDPVAEANYMHSIVGPIRDTDLIILDYEVQNPAANAGWAARWLAEQALNYGKLPGIYASDAYIRERLQYSVLAKYPLWLAAWTYNANVRPPCPPPWSSYTAWQFSDRATNVPGVPGSVDCNIFLGETKPMATTTIPLGWHDDGKTLTASNGDKVVLGFRAYVLAHSWNPDNVPLGEEYHADPAELHNPQSGAGQIQIFRDCVLVYRTDGRGVVTMAAGDEIAECYVQIAALKTQLKAAQTPLTVNVAGAIAAATVISTAANGIVATLPALKQALGVQ